MSTRLFSNIKSRVVNFMTGHKEFKDYIKLEHKDIGKHFEKSIIRINKLNELGLKNDYFKSVYEQTINDFLINLYNESMCFTITGVNNCTKYFSKDVQKLILQINVDILYLAYYIIKTYDNKNFKNETMEQLEKENLDEYNKLAIEHTNVYEYIALLCKTKTFIYYLQKDIYVIAVNLFCENDRKLFDKTKYSEYVHIDNLNFHEIKETVENGHVYKTLKDKDINIIKLYLNDDKNKISTGITSEQNKINKFRELFKNVPIDTLKQFINSINSDTDVNDNINKIILNFNENNEINKYNLNDIMILDDKNKPKKDEHQNIQFDIQKILKIKQEVDDYKQDSITVSEFIKKTYNIVKNLQASSSAFSKKKKLRKSKKQIHKKLKSRKNKLKRN